MQLENSTKQSEILTVQLEEAKQKKREVENKRATIARVLDEACRSLRNFDIQDEEESGKRIVKMKYYAQQS